MSLYARLIAELRGEAVPPRGSSIKGSDLVTIFLLATGGVIIPILGWVFAVILLWRSTTWDNHTKLLAAALPPLGFAPFVTLLAYPLLKSNCVTSTLLTTHSQIAKCAGGTFHYGALEITTLLVLLILPVITIVLLYSRAAATMEGSK